MTVTSVQRVDDRLGLAVCRVALGSRSMATYARDHVAVRTPSHPVLGSANSIDLLRAPEAPELAPWIDRARATLGAVGVPGAQIRWEEPRQDDSLREPSPDGHLLAQACDEQGLELRATSVLLLAELAAIGVGVPVETVELGPAADPRDLRIERLWHGSHVLHRYMAGDTPTEWRSADGAGAWASEVQREMVVADRARVWVALRHGMPVARLTLAHDRQGLAGVGELVVHPAHRRRGIAAALVSSAVSSYLTGRSARVGVVVDPGSPADLLVRRLGFRPHATVFTARVADDAVGPGRAVDGR